MSSRLKGEISLLRSRSQTRLNSESTYMKTKKSSCEDFFVDNHRYFLHHTAVVLGIKYPLDADGFAG